MIQPIYLYGSEVLRRTAEPADLSDREGIAALVQDLKDTLANAEGCGLAAPQIGVSKRVGSSMRKAWRTCTITSRDSAGY